MNNLIIFSSIFYLIFITSKNAVESLAVGHYHHNKRNQPQLTPTLTLDVEPHPGIVPSHVHTTAVPDYYFPVDAGLFNFTCTIKHPSYKYKLTITREQIFNNGEKGAPLELIDPSDYALNPTIKDPRMSIDYSEPRFLDPTANHLRVSLLIKNLKLEDNGVYTCKYSQITKKINTIVYKQATQKDVIFPSPKTDKLTLNNPVSISCRVNDIYPKPKVAFTHSSRDDLSEIVTEKDNSNIKQNDFYLYSLVSTINFTPKYTDNNQFLNCSVTSHTSTNTTIFKSLPLQVLGNQIVEEECNEVQTTKVGEQDFKIVCVFYSNPKLQPVWETKSDDAAEKTAGETSQTPAEGAAAEQETTTDEPRDEILKINGDGDETPNYVASIEEHGAPGSGLYKAVIKIKEVRNQDLKNFTFKLDHFERVIRVTREDLVAKDLSVDPNQSSAAVVNALLKSHSKVFIALMTNLVLFFVL